MTRRLLGVVILVFFSTSVTSIAEPVPNFTFDSIDGGKIQLGSYRGKAILATNTASKCGFTKQYQDLQELYEEYKSEGLVVIGIPSADFRQEYKNNDNIKNFCEINFGISFPMTEVNHVVGKRAHPFYKWLLEKHNFKPRWNFNKIIINTKGEVTNLFGATVSPKSPQIKKALVAAIKK